MKIATYNTRGLPKCATDLHLRPDIMQVLNDTDCDIVCLQETWFAKQDLKYVNSLHDKFCGTGCATVDYSSGIVCGHPPGGVLTLWRRSIESHVRPLNLNVDWCVGIEVNLGMKKFAVLNVYMPYQCEENHDEYLDKLGALGAIISELECSCFTIVGDFNANPLTPGHSTFSNLLQNFTEDLNLKLSTATLPEDSYTYVSAAWGTHSWLDHVISSEDFHATITEMDILYDITDEDHIPIIMNLNVPFIPECSPHRNDVNSRTFWNGLSPNQVSTYTNMTDEKLRLLSLNFDALSCQDMNCDSVMHKEELSIFYDNLVNILISSSETAFNLRKKGNFESRPGWSEYVADLYDTSRDLRKWWLSVGKPRQGPLHDMYISSKARFKYALRFIKRNEAKLRQESLARKMTDLGQEDFWKEVKFMNNSATPLPSCIDDNIGAENIVDMWKNHFQSIYNCLQRDPVIHRNCSDDFHNVAVSNKEVEDAIKDLKCGKSCGLDGINAEHLKYSSDFILTVLSKCFTSFLVHGFIPSKRLSVVLVPIIKDKTRKIQSKENYRPIALASVVSKVFEKVILSRVEQYISTSCNQFGFKKGHGTDQCIYILKEIIDAYNMLNGTVYTCFLDASKAFDRVNHTVLFDKLRRRGVPHYITRVLVYWYVNQMFCVRWGNIYSESFNVTNGVRQGGILSPLLFNVYMDDLSFTLNEMNVGCSFSNKVVNHLMYADDIVVFAPSAIGLKKLLHACNDYADEHDIKFNTSKSAVMIFRPKQGMKVNYQPEFFLNGSQLSITDSIKYLGHYFSNDLTDTKDIKRQCAKLYIQGNTIIRKFYMCTVDVKLTLFRCFCMPMYTPHLWWNYTKATINRLYVSYHNIFKLFLGFSKFESTSLLCTVYNTLNCASVIRHSIFRFMCRLEKSNNAIVRCLMSTSLLWTSRIRKKWCSLLFVNFM